MLDAILEHIPMILILYLKLLILFGGLACLSVFFQ